MLPNQPSSASHERIGRYEVLRKIATGGMAELFLAKQVGMEGFERVVALKRILAHLAYDEEFINMFRDEARIVAKLSHPNIVQIFDLGKSEDTYFIAMEYIPGRNLSSVAKKARARDESLPPENIARCVAQACEGLHYAHTRSDLNGKPLKIVHRDVSPQNIIVAFSGTVKLVDFGIAKAATKIAHTRAGVLKGKYAYMSPEQIRGEVVDARSDLFAVGIVLYELLCGRRPFEKENSIQTLKSIVQEPHRDCRELNSEIPDGLAEIIDKALTKDRDVRYQSAQELQLALEDFVSASGRRVNNLTVANWITKLFEEELSREQGGTIVFQGIGEVILPDVEDEAAADDDDDEISVEEELDPDEAAAHAERDLAESARGSDPGDPLPLTRGRGGGSIGLRPPIPAPSTSMPEEGEARESLIEEGVIDRPIERRDHYDDDATVHGTGANPTPTRESTEVPQPYSDDKTEFTSSHVVAPPSEPEAPAAQRVGSEVHTLVPDPPPPPQAETLSREESSAALLQPLSQVAEDDFEATDDPWDEATVGYPDGQPPEEFPAPVADVEDAPVLEPADQPLAAEDWGEISDADFEADATLAGLPEAWDDPTSAAGARLEDSGVGQPLVAEPLDYEDAEPLDIDLDDEPEDSGIPDATITQPSLGDEFGGDATIAVPSISDEIIERHASQYRGSFDDDATIGAAELEEGFTEDVSDADVQPLDFAHVSDDDHEPAPAAQWGADATVAGAPLPGISGLDPDEDFEFEVSEGDFDGRPPGLDVEIDHTVRAMDEEPVLPVPKTDRDIDQDARTVAGTTSDYLVAGVRPPDGGTYEPEARASSNDTPDYEMPGAPAKRGQGQLGAIKLSRVAVPRGVGSEENTEGEVSAYTDDAFDHGEIPGVQEDLPLDLAFDDDAPPVQPSPLEEPPGAASEPELPAALPGPTAASARDEYSSALLSPKLPTPINPTNQGDSHPGAGMAIGSTNVPPANLSLSQMLEHPSHASRSKLMAVPRGASGTAAPGRSASIVGRQIREVARAGEAPTRGPSVAGASGIMPPPAAPGVPSGEALPPMPGPNANGLSAPAGGPGAYGQEGLAAPPAPPPRGRGRRVVIGLLVALVVALLGGVAFLSYPLLFGQGGGGFSLFGPTEPRLTIKTNPAGASVYVDNALQRGTTPLTISGLEPGVTYTVRLVREGFEPVSQPVRLPPDRPLIWRIPLKAKSGP